jgi:hypothetical protein
MAAESPFRQMLQQEPGSAMSPKKPILQSVD